LSHFLGVRGAIAVGALVCAGAALVVWRIVLRMVEKEGQAGGEKPKIG
jgi:hypothetical protein